MTQLGGPLGKIRLGWKVAQTLGWRWVFIRLYLEAEHWSGVLRRRTPLSSWDAYQLDGESTCRTLPVQVADGGKFLQKQGDDVETALRAHLERIRRREFDLFGTICRLDSWHEEPITPTSYSETQHWSRVQEAANADLKLVWEASRFSWAFDLARLHGLDPSTAAPDVFWELLEDWCRSNQPNAGVNWKCGQESAIRLMAIVFATQVFGTEELDRHRELLLAKLADVTAKRIKAHWRYAKSQDNNHIVSEAVGLITVALVFPGLAIAAEARQLGERLLADACDRLVFPDGGTSQYSLNYHRVFMDNFVWAMWLYRSSEENPPKELEDALRRSHAFLLAITQRCDGSAGNWGNNDGAMLLPLASTRFLDVRPTLLMAAQALEGKTYDWGGWAEEAVHWLWGRPVQYLKNPPELHRTQVRIFPYAGISIITNGRHRALVRGGEHQLFRPPQCDFGHVELWVDGEQVVFDPGTWSYKPGPGEPDLSETQWHNMPHEPGEQQMTRLTRFLWGDWPTVTVRTSADNDILEIRVETNSAGSRTRRLELSAGTSPIRVWDDGEHSPINPAADAVEGHTNLRPDASRTQSESFIYRRSVGSPGLREQALDLRDSTPKPTTGRMHNELRRTPGRVERDVKGVG